MRRRWIFLLVAFVLTVVWVVAQLPRRLGGAPASEESRPWTGWEAGRPYPISMWSTSDDTGEVYTDTFKPGNILLNAVPLAALVGVAWFVIWPRRSKKESSGDREPQDSGRSW